MGTGKLYNIGYVSSQWISSNTLHSYTISCNTFKGPATAGGSATAAGGKYYVQYTDGTNLDSEGAFTYNETTNTLRISGAVSSSAMSGGTLRMGLLYGNTISGVARPSYPSSVANKYYIDHPSYVSSQGRISGQWWAPQWKGKPTAGAGYAGQIIRTSGASYSQKTYVWMCISKAAGTYEWIQLAVSSA